MKKSKKAAITSLVILLLFSMIQTVMAQVLGIDLIRLVQQKTAILAGLSISSTSSQLEQVKQETITDTVNFVTQYMNDIEQHLNQYATQELETAKQQIRAKGEEVKNILNVKKQEIINSEKAQIKIKIQEELNKKLTELENELSKALKEKLEN